MMHERPIPGRGRRRSRKRERDAVFSCLLILGLGCAGNRPSPPADDLGRLAWARQAFQEGEHQDVLPVLQDFLTHRSGSRYTEEARFLLAKTYYELGMDLEAEEAFKHLLSDFPAGEFAPEATYYLALTLLSQSRPAELDQTETRQALDQFRSFLSRYPGNPLEARAKEHILTIRSKLAKKEYVNGRLYLRRGLHRAARLYFEEKVLKEYSDTPWAAPAMLGMAESYEATREWENAARWAKTLIDAHPQSPEAESGRRILEEAKRQDGSSGDAAGGGSAAPSFGP